jgi:hypothetical protein
MVMSIDSAGFGQIRSKNVEHVVYWRLLLTQLISSVLVNTSKVPVLRYEIKNVDAEHNFVNIYFLIAIFKDIFAYHDLLITTFKRYT